MRAINIDIEQFVGILKDLWESGARDINLDMVPDENHPTMNKLIITPVGKKTTNQSPQEKEDMVIDIKNVSTENNDIFNMLNELI